MCWLCIEPPQNIGLNTYDMACSMSSCTKLCSHAKSKQILKRCSYFAMARNILHRLFLFVCLLQHVPIKQNDYHHWSQHGFLFPTLPICHMMYTNFQGYPYKSINMTFIHNHILVEMCVILYLCNSIGKLPFSYFYISQEALTHVKILIENNL